VNKTIRASILSLACAASFAAGADDSLVKFKGGIGVIPVSSAPGPAPTAALVNRNIVRGVQPSGQPWVIEDLRAEVSANGHVTVDGRALLIAGGNLVGTNANARVFATLVCEASAPFVERSTDLGGVALDASGDFRIDDALVPAPVDCANPALLIRNAANATWFAAGIAKR
jgi:hypothetical protein